MNSEDTLSLIPHELRSLPWMQQLIMLLQKQTEEIASLKKTVQEQKDEINRLKNMTKRPKFRTGGGGPKSRSGKPGSGKENSGSNSNNDMAPKKTMQEVIVPASDVPPGSRFKGYQEYAVQELEIVPKDVISMVF